MRVSGYCRVSTDTQVRDGDSLAVQRRQIEGYALMQGLDLGEVIVEEGVSGSVPVAERPAAGPLFATLKRGDIVIAAKLDRLFRRASDALNTVEALQRRGVALHLIDLQGDITDGKGKFFLTVVAAFAEEERRTIGERVRAAKRDRKARGAFNGGSVPFGFRKGEGGALEAVEGEQSAIGEMRALSAAGASLRAISAAMAAKGQRISHRGVRRVLRDAAAA